jgi:hypothetical protein
MQNRYAGDVGDFGKLAMLRQIADTGLAVGINWYLVANELHNNDGKHTGFLNDRRFDGLDDILRESLRIIVQGERSVYALESANLLPGAVYYSQLLLPPSIEDFQRKLWHENAINHLQKSDIVFLDPDNGIITKSIGLASRNSIKYVLREEICDYYARGHSVVVYNHRCREKPEKYVRRFDWMKDAPALSGSSISGLSFRRGTIRDYIFIAKSQHSECLSKAQNTLASGGWAEHFSQLEKLGGGR